MCFLAGATIVDRSKFQLVGGAKPTIATLSDIMVVVSMLLNVYMGMLKAVLDYYACRCGKGIHEFDGL